MNDFSLSDLATVVGNRDGSLGGDNGILWLILFIMLGGGFNNRGYGNGAGGVGGNELYPWLNNAENINGGFRDQVLNTSISGIQQGINGISAQLCNGFNQAEIGAANRQMANMQQAFAAQTATMQGFNGVQGQLADCCCENRLATANQTATILAEHCADRAALSDGVRDIIQSNTANTQSILDKLCQLELDGYKRQVADEQRANADLRSQLTQARFDASQQAQNAYIQQGFANEVDALYNRLSNCPVPSMPVYGRTPIFTCQPQNQGCGCNCGM